MAFPGDYTKYQEVTIDNTKVPSTQTDFPAFIDLSDLDKTTDIFDACRSDGGDIRVTLSDGTTQLAREIVSIDTSAKTGEMHIKITSLSGSADTVIRIWYNGVDVEPAIDSTYGTQNTWNNNYELVYHMDDATTTTILDSTSNGNDGTKGSATNPSEVSGKIGKAQDFSDDLITVSANAILKDLPITYDFTVSCWFNADVQDNDRPYFSWSGTDDLVLYPNDDISGTGGFRVFWRDIGGVIIDENGSDLSGTYYLSHFISRASNDHEAYRNASSVGTSSDNGPAGPFTDVFVGHFPSQSTDMQIDEVRVLSVALSDNWLTTEYNNQSSPSTFYSISDEISTIVATPIILPISGAYLASQLISMSCATSGADIYYTEDGSIPDATDTLYSTPFALGSAKTIKAIGIKSGLTDSDIVSETYTIAVIAIQPIITILT